MRRHAAILTDGLRARCVYSCSPPAIPLRVPELADWFLTAEERGNPTTTIPAWCAGSRAEPLIHGATYFDRLVTEVEALGDG